MGQITESNPTVLFIHGDAENAEVTHFRPQIARELIRGINRFGQGRNLVTGKLLHART